MPKWLKTMLMIIAGVVVFAMILCAAVFIYINSNKTKVLKLITTELNKGMNGRLTIDNMEPTFFKGFPGVSLSLKNVLIRDARWPEHHHTLLNAKDIDVSVNAMALMSGTISINHADISNAAIDLYTDSTGYSNTQVFKKSDKKQATPDNSKSATQIGKISLHNVSFAVNNQKANKLFQFAINNLEGDMKYRGSGWHAAITLDVLVKSLAFNTLKGSFVKNKVIAGEFIGDYNDKSQNISVQSDHLTIGGDGFGIAANFALAKNPSKFTFNITADQILWRNAAALVSANITQKLNMFDVAKPMDVKAIISGSFSDGGDPYLHITGLVRNNTLTIPGGVIDNCNFNAVYTNNYVNGKGFNDANSIIRIFNLQGSYQHLPFVIDTGAIVNLETPIATGNIRSKFPVNDLNYLLGSKVAKFGDGMADMNLRFKADVVNLRINKPMVNGDINIKNANITYVPRNIAFKNSSVSLHFIGDNLVLNNIRMQSGKSIVMMEGHVNNFLNLYYNAPEKILVNWQISSPQLHLAEFIGFLGNRKTTTKSTGNSGNIIDQLSNVLEKAQLSMHLQVAKAYYKKFLATDVRADLLTSENGVLIKNISVKHAGGSLQLDGRVNQGSNLNHFTLNTTVSNVNMREFFYAFDNFGLEGFSYQNLNGLLSAKAQLTGGLNDKGGLAPRSTKGTINISLKNAALINFKPITSVGKFAFPFRDLKNITIPNLTAKLDLYDGKITINPMQINSSVLNMDVAGVYSTGYGTNIALDIPLRNPKKDAGITDKDELNKRRLKGVVLHVAAKSDETGKIKIGWNKDRK